MLGELISSSSSPVFALVHDFPPYVRHTLPFPVWHFEVHSPEGGGRTPYNGLYQAAPPERGTFIKPQVCELVGISLGGVYKRVGKSFISVVKI